MLSKTLVVLSISLFALAVPLQERSVPTILADVAAVNSDLVTLNNDLKNLAAAGANGLAALQTDDNKLISDLEKSTADVQANGPLNEQDGQTVAAAVANAAGELISVLKEFDSTHGTFEQLNAVEPGLIASTEQGIEAIAELVQGFIGALDQVGPSDVVAAGAPLVTSVFLAFETAIATFQN
ncbi:hypothetical protein Clacol_009549 [Clathrus columnatus]|uniref:Uncharacterized protein n=1 Tax=Clathrus columnatus TaxID=1419009 RepID=A0AAV5AP50_9AGAM|nr:hypothetical protein Clacol_009549 [Clathrus columnatus]